VWDLDWDRFEASGRRMRKLSVIDTGTGMTAEQMRHNINRLAASGGQQPCTRNLAPEPRWPP
jgi:HSP90 family molecular chaperone